MGEPLFQRRQFARGGAGPFIFQFPATNGRIGPPDKPL